MPSNTYVDSQIQVCVIKKTGALCMIHDKRVMLHDDAPWLPGSLPEGAGGQAGTEAAEEEQY